MNHRASHIAYQVLNATKVTPLDRNVDWCGLKHTVDEAKPSPPFPFHRGVALDCIVTISWWQTIGAHHLNEIVMEIHQCQKEKSNTVNK